MVWYYYFKRMADIFLLTEDFVVVLIENKIDNFKHLVAYNNLRNLILFTRNLMRNFT